MDSILPPFDPSLYPHNYCILPGYAILLVLVGAIALVGGGLGSVPSPLYESTSTGQQVCIYLHAGALRIPWYVAAECL
jgi:hypothetical protein